MQDNTAIKQSQVPNRRAYKHNVLAQPFLKWAGGKRQLLTVLKEYLPKKFTQYYEPFIGYLIQENNNKQQQQ